MISTTLLSIALVLGSAAESKQSNPILDAQHISSTISLQLDKSLKMALVRMDDEHRAEIETTLQRDLLAIIASAEEKQPVKVSLLAD